MKNHPPHHGCPFFIFARFKVFILSRTILDLPMAELNKTGVEYTEDSIRSLDWREHIRLRPSMYIGKLGDGRKVYPVAQLWTGGG